MSRKLFKLLKVLTGKGNPAKREVYRKASPAMYNFLTKRGYAKKADPEDVPKADEGKILTQTNARRLIGNMAKEKGDQKTLDFLNKKIKRSPKPPRKEKDTPLADTPEMEKMETGSESVEGGIGLSRTILSPKGKPPRSAPRINNKTKTEAEVSSKAAEQLAPQMSAAEKKKLRAEIQKYIDEGGKITRGKPSTGRAPNVPELDEPLSEAQQILGVDVPPSSKSVTKAGKEVKKIKMKKGGKIRKPKRVLRGVGAAKRGYGKANYSNKMY